MSKLIAKTRGRKGIEALLPAVLGFAVIVLVAAFTVLLLTRFKTSSGVNDSTVNETIDTGIEAITLIIGFLGIIALALVFVVVIGYLRLVGVGVGANV